MRVTRKQSLGCARANIAKRNLSLFCFHRSRRQRALRNLRIGKTPPLSPEAPIVLLRKIQHPLPEPPGTTKLHYKSCPRKKSESDAHLAKSIAPGNPNLGVMLPYTPLHHLLMRELNFPDRRDEREFERRTNLHRRGEALKRLRGIADYFLVTIGRSFGTSTTRSCGPCMRARIDAAPRAVLRRHRRFICAR